MKVLVFGRTGQVARELARRCPQGLEAILLGREAADLADPETIGDIITSRRPTAVINAAAWTAVDRAETEEDAATIVNATSPGRMAEACAALGIPLVHLSTDYVFDGSGETPWSPDDTPAPINAYGRSKLAGEQAIRATGAKHLIIRTSWLVSAHGSNFIKTMLRLGKERSSLSVVADQIGGPTPAAAIADAIYTALEALQGGAPGATVHFAGAPDVSWADLARAVMTGARLNCLIEDIPSSAYPTPARRPANSRLDCTIFERDFGVKRPDWRAGLDDILHELGELA